MLREEGAGKTFDDSKGTGSQDHPDPVGSRSLRACDLSGLAHGISLIPPPSSSTSVMDRQHCEQSHQNSTVPPLITSPGRGIDTAKLKWAPLAQIFEGSVAGRIRAAGNHGCSSQEVVYEVISLMILRSVAVNMVFAVRTYSATGVRTRMRLATG